jgi:hypothetical protein
VLGYLPSFYANAWGVARPDWFGSFQRGSECHVLGRLVKSRQDGILSGAGLLGVGASGLERPAAPAGGIRFRRNELASGIHLREGEEWPAGGQIEEQYDSYLGGGRFAIFSPYASQIGGQGLVFGALDASLPFRPALRLRLLLFVTALLSASALAMLTQWFGRQLSFGLGLVVLASGVFSQWLTGFGRNLWWGLWAFYVPFLVVARLEAMPRAPGARDLWRRAAWAFGAVLLKCFVNGYEFITTTLVMMTAPCLFAALRDRVPPRALVGRLAALALGATLAVAASLGVLAGQLAALAGGNLGFGLRHIGFALATRTAADAAAFPPSYAAGLRASRWSVLLTYLKGSYAELGPLALRYDVLLGAVLLASLGLLWLDRGTLAGERRALVWTTWYSLLAPLSWLTIFKAHSYAHTHMNFILWQMPFSFFGFAVIGMATRLLFAKARKRSA